MKKSLTIFAIFIGLVFYSTAGAQGLIPGAPNVNIENILPGPARDLLNMAEKIHIDVSRIPIVNKFIQSIQSSDFQSGDFIRSLENVWERLNAWLEQNIGVSLKEIIRGIGNLFVWIFEFIVNLIKAGISHL